MKSTIRRIGNSRGVIIPQHMIEECGMQTEVDIRVDDGNVIISPVRRPREGWFDRTIDPKEDPSVFDLPPDHDVEGWEW